MDKIRSNGSLIINSIFIIFGSCCLYFAANLWIGSEEQYEELMMNHWNSFLLKKFVFNLFIIVLLLVFMAVLNKLLKNEKIKSTLFYALILFVLTSIITIYASTKCF